MVMLSTWVEILCCSSYEELHRTCRPGVRAKVALSYLCALLILFSKLKGPNFDNPEGQSKLQQFPVSAVWVTAMPRISTVLSHIARPLPPQAWPVSHYLQDGPWNAALQLSFTVFAAREFFVRWNLSFWSLFFFVALSLFPSKGVIEQG